MINLKTHCFFCKLPLILFNFGSKKYFVCGQCIDKSNCKNLRLELHYFSYHVYYTIEDDAALLSVNNIYSLWFNEVGILLTFTSIQNETMMLNDFSKSIANYIQIPYISNIEELTPDAIIKKIKMQRVFK